MPLHYITVHHHQYQLSKVSLRLCLCIMQLSTIGISTIKKKNSIIVTRQRLGRYGLILAQTVIPLRQRIERCGVHQNTQSLLDANALSVADFIANVLNVAHYQ